MHDDNLIGLCFFGAYCALFLVWAFAMARR